MATAWPGPTPPGPLLAFGLAGDPRHGVVEQKPSGDVGGHGDNGALDHHQVDESTDESCRCAAMRELPRGPGADVMAHGDLIPGNLLVSNGRLVGILDVGGLGPADPALDLVGAWQVLEAGPRRAFREDLGFDDLEWERGKARAFEPRSVPSGTTSTATRP